MDIFKQFAKEYEDLKALAGSYPADENEFEFYIETVLLRVWGANAMYSEDYAKAVRAISGRSRSAEEILKAMVAATDVKSAGQIPQFFADMVEDDVRTGGEAAEAFAKDLRSFLVGGASINGDFTIGESAAVSGEIRKLMQYALSRGAKIGYATGRNPEKVTPLKEDSYTVGQGGAPGPDLGLFFEALGQTFLRPAQMKREELASGGFFSGMTGAKDPNGAASSGTTAGKPGEGSGRPGENGGTAEAGGALSGGDAKADTPADAQASQDAQEAEEQVDTRTMEELMAELDGLVGLDSIKADIHSLMNFIAITKLRQERGMNVPTISYHLVFTGNPGTGKTTVARLVAGLYARIGILPKGQLVEVDRGQLVAGYTGQTAIKTMEVINRAMGGVLFIDEAYALVNDEQDSFGKEAVETILKAMEDHRDELVVIVAGYTELMHKFIESNPGFKSRFSKFFEFPDYTGEELMQIFRRFCDSNGYTLGEGAEELLQKEFQEMYETRSQHFGNGRTVRNVFEKAIHRQADRLSAETGEVSDEKLQELTVSDLSAALESERGKFRATDE